MQSRHISRAIVFDRVDNVNLYLLLKTKKGYWQNPQGGIDEGENDLSAIFRETNEETGLNGMRILYDTRFLSQYYTTRKGQPIHTMCISYAVKADSTEPIVLSEEDDHTDYIWADYNTALSLLTKYSEQKDIFINTIARAYLQPRLAEKCE